MLRQGIPHVREEADELAWSGESQIKLEHASTSPPLIIAYGMQGAELCNKVLSASTAYRQLVPAIPVGLEVAAGTVDGVPDYVGGIGGAKRITPQGATKRLPVVQVCMCVGVCVCVCVC
jgi:hypothetical protein